jgi:hypothetical protein
MEINNFQRRQCHQIIAKFLRHLYKYSHARWVPIINYETGNLHGLECLSHVMALSYDSLYLPLMLHSGLLYVKEHNRWKTKSHHPSIKFGCQTGAKYSWEELFSEYMLYPYISEISSQWVDGKECYFIRIGNFKAERFTILDQLKNPGVIFNPLTGLSRAQKSLAERLADALPLSIAAPSVSKMSCDESGNDDGLSSGATSYCNQAKCSRNDNLGNYMNFLQAQLFDQILKPGINSKQIWDLIDASKLKDGLDSMFKALQHQKEETRWNNLQLIGESTPDEIQLREGKSIKDFPALSHYGIPLKLPAIHSVLRDIVTLSKVTIQQDVLTFRMFNRSDITSTIVRIPTSVTYTCFKKNVKRESWLKRVLLAASREDEGEVAARWLLQLLGLNSIKILKSLHYLVNFANNFYLSIF